MTEIQKLIEHFERELQYLDTIGGDKYIGKCLIAILKTIDSLPFSVIDLKSLFGLCIKYLNTNVLSPLTLNEGEFIYTKPGLSINRRNPNIKMDIHGIYYENAFTRDGVIGYDSFTGKSIEETNIQIDISELKNLYEDERIFIIAGLNITPVYFTKAYLLKKTIISGSYLPAQPISLNLDIIINSNTKRYISCIRNNNPSLSKLNSMYHLDIQEDYNEELLKYNVNLKYSKDAVYNEERSAFYL